MLTGQHINLADPEYAPSLVRPPSPSSSIGTDYGPDETTPEESAKSPEQFSRECEARIMLTVPRPEEEEANKDILLKRPKTQIEEREMHRTVMENLRNAVRKLQEDELYEQIMLRGTQVTNVQQPSSNNIDVIMQSIMGPPTTSTSPVLFPPPTSPFPQSPSFAASPAHSHASFFGTGNAGSDVGSPTSSTTKRTTRARKAKSRR
ncbi:unnamed protein product [Somion occarium]|uniref:Period n=1 Tax=Somion occarium TaxID=3059160 RepID=A0ABP1E254_9APHY